MTTDDAAAGTENAPSISRRQFVQSGSLAMLAAGSLGSAGETLITSEAARAEAAPRAVREIESVWIPMPDGTRLAAIAPAGHACHLTDLVPLLLGSLELD